MPILAAFLGSAITSLGAFFAKFMVERVAILLAAFIAWLAVLAAFVTSLLVCLHSLLSTVQNVTASGGDWVRFFFMGLGMFIPSNAGAVMACLGSVWIGTEIYKIRKTGIQVFGK